ncbi:MAG: ABC transporter ATP-binding protein, partial [Anaerolineae bacterium]|nr:ABC transporter ATP-binding protein [Anaerolineae bacterium]
ATSVYVTHDQIEAMAMGDRIVVMSAAEVQQIGTPAEVYHDPSNLFVARFIGSPGMNLLEGTYHNGVVMLPDCGDYTVPEDWVSALNEVTGGDGVLILGFRPEAAHVTGNGGLPATVYANDLHGGYTMLHLDIGQDRIVHARAGRETQYPINTMVKFDLDPTMVCFFDPTTENAIRKEATA